MEAIFPTAIVLGKQNKGNGEKVAVNNNLKNALSEVAPLF